MDLVNFTQEKHGMSENLELHHAAEFVDRGIPPTRLGGDNHWTIRGISDAKKIFPQKSLNIKKNAYRKGDFSHVSCLNPMWYIIYISYKGFMFKYII